MYAIDLLMTGLRSSKGRVLRRYLPRLWREERGSSIIELGLVIMIMLSFVVGAVDLGYAYQHYGVVLNSSREGARLYSRLPCTGSNRFALRNAIIDAVVTEAGGGRVNVRDQDVIISPDPASGCPTEGSPVDVQVRIRYNSQFGELIGIDTIPISASTSMVYYGTDISQSGS